MIVIPPLTITDAILTSSNVPETDFQEWLVGDSYDFGEKVMVATGTPDVHRNYESLIVGIGTNTGIDPTVDQLPAPTGTGGANWLDLGATNTFAMFDEIVGTQTTNLTSVDVVLTPGEVINAVAVLNVSAATVQVIVDDPIDGVVFDRTVDLTSAPEGINDWYAYYFTAIETVTDIVFTDLPSFKDATIQVIATETGVTVAVGVLAIGAQVKVGTTNHGTGISIKDFSIKQTDSFGNFVILERAFSKRADYAVTVNTNRVAFVQNFLTSIRATPVVWVGNEDFGSTIIYGYYRDFDIVLSSPPISACNIVVEGLA